MRDIGVKCGWSLSYVQEVTQSEAPKSTIEQGGIPTGCCYIFVDAACSSVRNASGIGVVALDACRNVLGAVAKQLSNPFNPLLSETAAIKEGYWWS
uniref:Uncharacterized protein n=1 Tax=Cucumis sativus TaxID=3659 RepID=A0A0A0M389_CUCSA